MSKFSKSYGLNLINYNNDDILYLDSNAHVPMSLKTKKEYYNFLSGISGHGHPLSPSKPGRIASKIIEDAREKIAKLIGAQSSNQIFFTHSCSEACAWAIKIVCNKYDTISYSPIEHYSVDSLLKSNTNVKLNIDDNCIVDMRAIKGGIVCIHLHNETGVIQPIDNHMGYLFSDMSQSLGKINVNVTNLNVDLAAFGGHKFGGPTGVGILYIKDTNDWIEYGTGSRYMMDIPGTPNVSAIGTTAIALEEAINTLPSRQKNMKEFQLELELGLEDLGFKVMCKNANRSLNTTFVQTSIDSMEILNKLGENNIFCGLGSACGSLHGSTSGLMSELGVSTEINSYLRISQWGQYGKSHAKYFLEKLSKAICAEEKS